MNIFRFTFGTPSNAKGVCSEQKYYNNQQHHHVVVSCRQTYTICIAFVLFSTKFDSKKTIDLQYITTISIIYNIITLARKNAKKSFIFL